MKPLLFSTESSINLIIIFQKHGNFHSGSINHCYKVSDGCSCWRIFSVSSKGNSIARNNQYDWIYINKLIKMSLQSKHQQIKENNYSQNKQHDQQNCITSSEDDSSLLLDSFARVFAGFVPFLVGTLTLEEFKIILNNSYSIQINNIKPLLQINIWPRT